MAAYNVEPYIGEAIRSALTQEIVDVEVIVIDDASTDGTRSEAAAIAAIDARVTIVSQKNQGPSAARNAGMALARGTWMAILDADDLILPERSLRLLTIAKAHGCDIVCDNLLRFPDGNMEIAWPLLNQTSAQPLRVELAEYLLRNRMMRGDDNLGYLKPMFSRAFIEKNKLRYDEAMRIGEDFNFCVQCLARGASFIVTPEPYYLYRVRGGSLSRQLKQADVDDMIVSHKAALADAGTLDRRTLAADMAYRRSLKDAVAFAEFRECVRQRRWGAALWHLLHPGIWGTTGHVAYGVLKRRRARANASLSVRGSS